MSVTEAPAAAPATSEAVTGYEEALRFYATRYKQGGRTVYALDLSLEQLTSLIGRPDPDKRTPGNRQIRVKHAADFAAYVRGQSKWVVPALILRAPAIFDFEPQVEVAGTEFGIVSFPRLSLTDLHILDGQHRILGVHIAKQGIADDLDKARSQKAKARRQDDGSGALVREADKQIAALEAQRRRLANERISLQVFIEEDLTAYRQMFFDIADNALGITSSVKARFDSRKVVNRSLEYVLEHPLLDGRVDLERDRVGRGSPYLLGAKHVAEVIRSVTVGLDGRVGKRMEDSLAGHEKEVAEEAKKFFDVLVQAFPQFQAMLNGQLTPDRLRRTSLLGSVLFLRILAGVYYDLLKDHGFDRGMVADFFARLLPHLEAPVYPGSIWMDRLEVPVFTDGAYAPNGRRQDSAALKDALVAWAIDKPAWLSEPPAPRPTPPATAEGTPLEELTEPQIDEILRPETAAARKHLEEAANGRARARKRPAPKKTATP